MIMANYFLKQKQLQSQNVKLKFTGAERATVQARVGLGCVKDGWSCVLGYTGFFSYTERQLMSRSVFLWWVAAHRLF
jgi:hypothetical protein